MIHNIVTRQEYFMFSFYNIVLYIFYFLYLVYYEEYSK